MRYLSILICLCMFVGCAPLPGPMTSKPKCPSNCSNNTCKCVDTCKCSGCTCYPCHGKQKTNKPNVDLRIVTVRGMSLNENSLTVEGETFNEGVRTYNIGPEAKVTWNGLPVTHAQVYKQWKLEVNRQTTAKLYVHAGHYVSQAEFRR